MVLTSSHWFLQLEEIVLFVNAGSKESIEPDFGISFRGDKFFEGGDTFQTEELISSGGDYPFIYQSARLGDFCYRIDGLSPGDYFLDLHFVELINIDGPKGMRVFNVFVKDEMASWLIIASVPLLFIMLKYSCFS